jgi:hypothetical protein
LSEAVRGGATYTYQRGSDKPPVLAGSSGLQLWSVVKEKSNCGLLHEERERKDPLQSAQRRKERNKNQT